MSKDNAFHVDGFRIIDLRTAPIYIEGTLDPVDIYGEESDEPAPSVTVQEDSNSIWWSVLENAAKDLRVRNDKGRATRD